MTTYKRVKDDETGLEPRKFFNLVQFLMYDENQEGKVIPEQTLQIIYVRKGRDGLNEEIEEIFGKEMKNPDGTEKEITYPEYVAKVNQRALLDLKAQLLVK